MEPNKKHIEAVKSLWGFSEDLEFKRKVENWIYTVKGKPLIVRLTEPSHRDEDQIKAELDWMHHLKNLGVKFAHAVKSKEDNYVELCEDSGENYFISVFEEAKGKHLQTPADYTETRVKKWGELVGQMHAATKFYAASQSRYIRPQWDEDRNYLLAQKLASKDAAFGEKFNKLSGWMKTLPKDKNVYGLVHADVHSGNFFVDEQDNITVFDFDDCHFHWFVYDIAVIFFLNELFFEEKGVLPQWQGLTKVFWEGYKSKNQLAPEWISTVPKFVTYRTMIMYAWCLETQNAPHMSDKGKEWMKQTIAYCEKKLK